MKDDFSIKHTLRVDELTVWFGRREVLSGVSLEVSAGEIAALLGANGSGKSTLLQTVVGIIQSCAGDIALDGQNIGGYETPKIARMGISYLMQSNSVFPSLTVSEHLQLVAEMLGGKKANHSGSLIRETFPQLESQRNKRAGLLSGGERQILAFAMLLVQKAKVWLLDEPSAGLAPPAVSQLLGLVRRLSAELGIAVLLVEQNVGEALRIADKVYVLESGRIRQENRHPAIKSDFSKENVLIV